MQVVLVMFRSDGERRSFSVVRNMTVIGRREDCDLRIPVGDVSRKHCRLVRTDDGIRIEDLGSSNGTHVNGDRVQESDLHPGDVVGIGPVQFIVQIDGVPDEDEMTAPSKPRAQDESSMMGTPVPAEELAPEEEMLEEDVLEEAVSPKEYHVEHAHTAASQTPTIDEDEMVLDEHDAEVEPLEELRLDDVPAEEEETAAVEEPLGELEEDPLGLEEITEEEPAAAQIHTEEELGLEEFPLDETDEETAEHSPPTATTVPPTAAPVPPPKLDDELQLDELKEEHPAEQPALEEPLDGLEMLDEPSEPAAAVAPTAQAPRRMNHVDPAALLPAEPVEEIEPVNLEDELSDEESEPRKHAATGKAADESAWDFVIEETDGERSHHDFKIDLDSPSHP